MNTIVFNEFVRFTNQGCPHSVISFNFTIRTQPVHEKNDFAKWIGYVPVHCTHRTKCAGKNILDFVLRLIPYETSYHVDIVQVQHREYCHFVQNYRRYYINIMRTDIQYTRYNNSITLEKHIEIVIYKVGDAGI